MAKVSILVPVYNVEGYIRECLDSLVNQTLKDIEIVCINDGSTDGSLAIMEEYQAKDARIKIISKPNSGYGHSMNVGLNAATGDYVGIVEPDDYADLSMYEELYKIAEANPEINMIKSDWYWYVSKKNQARKAGKIKKDGIVNIRKAKKLLRYQAIWTGLYKREFLNSNNIRFLETPGASYQDTSFAFKTFALAENIYLTKKAYIYYRTDNSNSSVKSKQKVYYICTEHEEIARFLAARESLKKDLLTAQRVNQYRAYRTNVIRIDAQFRDEFIQRFQSTFKNYVNQETILDGFYKKINRKEFQLLLTDAQQYRAFIDKTEIKKNKSEERSKLFSVRINRSRVSVVLFGKQIVEIG